VTYRLLMDTEAHRYLESLDEKSQRIIKQRLKVLQENPYPGSGGDKEKLYTDEGYL